MKELKVTFIYLILLVMVTGWTFNMGTPTSPVQRGIASVDTGNELSGAQLALLFLQLTLRHGIPRESLLDDTDSESMDESEAEPEEESDETVIEEYAHDDRLSDDGLTFTSYRLAGQRPAPLSPVMSERPEGRPEVPESSSNGGLIAPLCECTTCAVTSNFGRRWGRDHEGKDIGAASGTPYYAACDGVVEKSTNEGAYGNTIEIRCDYDQSVVIKGAHLRERSSFTVGQRVQQGQLIGRVGNTGRSTGPHLHFEVRIGGTAVDPTPVLDGQRIARNFFSQSCPDQVVAQNPTRTYRNSSRNSVVK